MLIVWCAIICIAAMPGLFTGRRGIKRNARTVRFWAKGVARILNLTIEVHGDPEKFAGGLIVSNHLGYMDVISEGAVFPIRFAPKKEIKNWPFLGWLTAVSRPVWIDRSSPAKSRQVAKEIEATVNDNISMLVYPEGTSTGGKDGLLPFKSTPFEAAVRTGKPLLPILVKYALPPDGVELAWYGNMTFPPHVWHMLGQKKMKADIWILPELTPLPGEDRKALAARIHKTMDLEYRRII